MTTYIIRRLLQAVVVLFLATVMIFLLMRLLPGDPINLIVLQSEIADMGEEKIQELRHEAGLDRPLYEQYLRWVGGVLKGDLGKSIVQNTPVAGEILRRFPITLHIGLLGWIIGNLVGIGIGVACAVRRGSWIDDVLTTFATVTLTIPVFWLGIMLIYVVGVYLGWVPIGGYTSPFEDLWLNSRQILLPVLCLSVFPLGAAARQTRSSMLEVLRQDYIRTAWAKGLRGRVVVLKHALKNALIPVVTVSGIGLCMTVGGSVLVETVFAIPGVGRLLVTSVLNNDYPYVQAIALILSCLVLLINLITDISYGWLDPRVRYS